MTTLFEDPAMGLGNEGDLTARPGPAGIGMADSGGKDPLRMQLDAMAPQQAAASAEKPQMDLMQHIGKAMYNFNAGVEGRPSFDQVQEERQQKTAVAKSKELKEHVDALESGNKIAKTLTGEARTNFVNDYSKQLNEMRPGLGDTFSHVAEQPDILDKYASYMPYLPEAMKTMAKTNPDKFWSVISSPEGMKEVDRAKDMYYGNFATKKAQTMMMGLDHLGLPDDLVAQAKKGMTASVFNKLQAALPEGSPVKLSEAENNAVKKDGGEIFFSGLGILSPKHEQQAMLKKLEGNDNNKYSNVQQSPDGKGFVGLNKQTGKMERIPGESFGSSPADARKTGAMVATGMPISQAVPGYGKAATVERKAARDSAIAQIKEQNPGMSDEQAATELANRTIDFAAGKRSVTQLQTMLGATRQAVDQLDFNVKKVTEQMDKLPSSDISPVINAIARGASKWTGDPAYSSLFYYMHAAGMESARILQGGQASIAQLHQGAADEAKKWADANFTTPKAWKEGVAPAMQAEGSERIKTYERAIAKQRPGGGTEAPQTAEEYTKKHGKPPPSIGNKDGFDKLEKGDGYIDSRDGKYKLKG